MRNSNTNIKTEEDYLEAILMIQEEQGYVRSIDLAEHMGVAKPSVTYITKRLKEKEYITTDHAGMLVLTDAGAKIARDTYTRHKTLAKFLEMLGVSPEQAVTDACLIEHDVSPETFRALKKHIQAMEKDAVQN